VDTDRHQQSLEIDLLRAALSTREDSYWEMLAAAAGSPAALERVQGGLSRDALDGGSDGAAIAPSIVSERVEALAAWDPARLEVLARSWRAPAEVAEDPLWLAAWTSALRHLHARGGTDRRAFAIPALATEASVLWPEPRPARSWDEIVRDYGSRFVAYETVRLWATGPLSDAAIRADQLSNAPLALLRVLRGRERLLTADARELWRTWTTDAHKRDPLDAAVAIELASKVEPVALSHARVELTSALRKMTDARAAIPLAYVLVSPYWVAP
jgi:hypothetical protein